MLTDPDLEGMLFVCLFGKIAQTSKRQPGRGNGSRAGRPALNLLVTARFCH
jgi:hypothetical protein